MTVYVIPDQQDMTPNQQIDLQERLQHLHEEKVIVLPPRSIVVIDRETCPTCGHRLDES